MSGFDETFDFVVVGCGGGSMCAGLVMRKSGKSVVILEKTDKAGGTTARSGGVMWIPNNRFMKRDGVPDSYEAAAAYLDATVGNDPVNKGATRERRLTYLTEAPQMVDFLVDQGIKLTRVSYYPDYYNDRPGGCEQGRTVVAELFDTNELGPWRDKLRSGFLTIPAMLEEAMELPYMKRSWYSKKILLKVIFRAIMAKLTGKRFVSAGAALQGRMLQAALKAGIDIRLDTPVSELIIENGAVVGVATTKNGKPWRIGARLGVLVNAGGFARNQRMRDKYQPGTSANWTVVAPGDTGEMIEEMMGKGAATAQMREMVGYQMTTPPGVDVNNLTTGMQPATAAPHGILVDQSGVRYMTEAGSYMAYCRAMIERNKTVPAIPSWGIFDEQYMRNYMFLGTMPGTKKPQRWYDEGFLHRANTIEELAAKIKIDPATLKGTVERFNGFVAKNRDEDFGRGANAYDTWLGDYMNKPSGSLGTIAEGPFYAVPVYPGDVGTYGGVVTDVNARVLREDGSVIPGLYATGVSTASVMGPVYPGAGCSVGPSFVWGYVAAKHAAGASNSLSAAA
jgi:3-oxosteroid 1-dehydrogenase